MMVTCLKRARELMLAVEFGLWGGRISLPSQRSFATSVYSSFWKNFACTEVGHVQKGRSELAAPMQIVCMSAERDSMGGHSSKPLFWGIF